MVALASRGCDKIIRICFTVLLFVNGYIRNAVLVYRL